VSFARWDRECRGICNDFGILASQCQAHFREA
jgi:hypothetical protein